MKSSKQLERHFKGVANHRRIQILSIIAAMPHITLEQISGELNCNLKTISEHTRRLVAAGLVTKRYRGRKVEHDLSLFGIKIFTILKTF